MSRFKSATRFRSLHDNIVSLKTDKLRRTPSSRHGSLYSRGVVGEMNNRQHVGRKNLRLYRENGRKNTIANTLCRRPSLIYLI